MIAMRQGSVVVDAMHIMQHEPFVTSVVDWVRVKMRAAGNDCVRSPADATGDATGAPAPPAAHCARLHRTAWARHCDGKRRQAGGRGHGLRSALLPLGSRRVRYQHEVWHTRPAGARCRPGRVSPRTIVLKTPPANRRITITDDTLYSGRTQITCPDLRHAWIRSIDHMRATGTGRGCSRASTLVARAARREPA